MKCLLFLLGKEQFALPVDQVDRVSECGPVTPVPRVPSHVVGVRSHLGRVIPVLRLDLRFGFEVSPLSQRLVVVRVFGEMLSFFVDRVVDFLWIDSSQLVDPPVGLRGMDPGAIEGVFVHESQSKPIYLLRPEVLLGDWKPQVLSVCRFARAPGTRRELPEEHLDLESLFIFQMGRRRMGLAADRVDRVFSARDVKRMPAPMPGVDGLVQVGGESYPLIDPIKCLGGAVEAEDSSGTGGDDGRILLVRAGSKRLGLSIESEGAAVAIVDRLQIRPAEELVGHQKMSSVDYFAEIESMEEVVPLLNMDRFLEMAGFGEQSGVGSDTKRERNMNRETRLLRIDPSTRQFVIFWSDSKRYAVNIESVREVVRWSEPLTIPGAPGDIEGLINLRGQLVTLLNLSRRLGQKKNSSSESRIVVLSEGGMTAGVAVENRTVIKHLDPKMIEPPPEGLRGNAEGMIQGVVALGDQELISVLDAKKVLQG
jgi:purine-binding chemotaxis protein CheW